MVCMCDFSDTSMVVSLERHTHRDRANLPLLPRLLQQGSAQLRKCMSL